MADPVLVCLDSKEPGCRDAPVAKYGQLVFSRRGKMAHWINKVVPAAGIRSRRTHLR